MPLLSILPLGSTNVSRGRDSVLIRAQSAKTFLRALTCSETILRKPSWPTFAPEPLLTPVDITRDEELLEGAEEKLRGSQEAVEELEEVELDPPGGHR